MRRFILTISSIVFALSANAQNSNLNPTVQVTNEYKGEAVNADREILPIPVPDSLLKFDLNFDYSGFDVQYKGNSDFNPTLTQLEFSSETTTLSKGYLKFGAGYSLKPTLDAAFDLKKNGNFKMGAYANLDSYFGSYDFFEKGYEAKANAGFRGRNDWEKNALLMDFWYDGVYASDQLSELRPDNSRGYNSGSFKLRLISNPAEERKCQYAFQLNATYGNDKYSDYTLGDKRYLSVNEADATLSGNALWNVGNYSAVGFDLAGKYVMGWNDKVSDGYSGFNVLLAPKCTYSKDDLFLEAGLSMIYLANKGKTGDKSSAFAIAPLVKLEWKAVKNNLVLFMNSRLDQKIISRRTFILDYCFLLGGDSGANVAEYTFDLGIKGNIKEWFDYNLSGGFANENGPVFSVNELLDQTSLVCQNMNDIFAALDMRINYEGFFFDTSMKYKYFLDQEKFSCLPSNFALNAETGYNFRNRASAAIGVDYRTQCKAGSYTVPGFADLYVNASYKINRMITVFLDGHNLLNSQRQYIPLYSQKSICITAGLVLNF